MGLAIERDDSSLVHHLAEDHHVPWTLNDLVVGEVSRAVTSAHPRYSGRYAANRVAELLRARGRTQPRRYRVRKRGLPALCFRCQRRDFAIRGIDDQRCAIVELADIHHFGAGGSVRTLELIDITQSGEKEAVPAGVVAFAGFEDPLGPLFQCGHLRIGKKLAPLQLLWTFQGSRADVPPDAP